MVLNLYEHLDNWEKLAVAKKNLYQIIAEHEINNTCKSKEYKSMRDLLPATHQFEKKAVEDINFTQKKLELAFHHLSRNDDLVSEEFDGNNYTEMYHMSNVLSLLAIENYQAKNTPRNLYELMHRAKEHDKHKNENYQVVFQSIVTRNCIKAIDNYIKTCKDERTREYLIKHKYLLIYITPLYEEDFICFNKVLPFISLDKCYHLIMENGYSPNEYKELNKYNIKTQVSNIISSFMFCPPFFYESFTPKMLNLKAALAAIGYLVSSGDIDFAESIKREIDQTISNHNLEITEMAIKHIDFVFEEAFKALNANKNNKRLEKDNKNRD